MGRLAVVIPWWNEHPGFENTLASVLQFRPEDCQVWVVHNKPYDDPWELSGEVNFLHCDARSEVELVERGWRHSSSQYVHILRCGYEATQDWADEALAHFQEERTASAVPVIVPRQNRHQLAAAGVSLTRHAVRHVVGEGWLLKDVTNQLRTTILGPTLAAGFYCRAALEQAGGFDRRLDMQGADIDLACTLRQLGFSTCLVESSIVLGPAELPAVAGFRAALLAARLYWRYAPRPRIWAHVVRTVQVVGRIRRCRSMGQVLGELSGSLLGYLETLGRRSMQSPARGPSAPVIVSPTAESASHPAGQPAPVISPIQEQHIGVPEAQRARRAA